jgi:hypothetical protein
MKGSWTWAVLAVAGCAGGPVGGGDGHSALLISMHIASEEEKPGLQPISFEGREVFMEPDPFLGDPEIVAVAPVRVDTVQAAVPWGGRIEPDGWSAVLHGRLHDAESVGVRGVSGAPPEPRGTPVLNRGCDLARLPPSWAATGREHLRGVAQPGSAPALGTPSRRQ